MSFAANVLLHSRTSKPHGFAAKLADFGACVRTDMEQSLEEDCSVRGTFTHIAPEIIDGQSFSKVHCSLIACDQGLPDGRTQLCQVATKLGIEFLNASSSRAELLQVSRHYMWQGLSMFCTFAASATGPVVSLDQSFAVNILLTDLSEEHSLHVYFVTRSPAAQKPCAAQGGLFDEDISTCHCNLYSS